MGLMESLARGLTGGGESGGVQAAREAAFRIALERGVPSLREEDWRYTDLSSLAGQEFTTAAAGALPGEALPLDGLDAWRLVFVNGRFSAQHSDLAAIPPGVTVRLLEEMSRQDPQWLAEHLARQAVPEARTFVALNAAAAPDGLHVEIAPDTRLGKPLLVVFATVGMGTPALVSPHLHVQAGRHSQLELIELHTTQGAGATLTNAHTRIETADGAVVAHYRAVCDGSEGSHIGSVQLSVARDSRVENFSLVLGGRMVRVDIDGRLGAQGGELKLNGMFIAGQDQHVDHHTRVDHAASHTTSDEVYKGIADGNGQGVFNGRVLVREGVEKVVATQASNNLLLATGAEIDAKPELEIYANDLRCSHGATVGQLDDDSLFYLCSRGVPAVEARALLTYGFVQSLVESIPHAALQALVTARFARENPALARLLAGDYT